MLLLSAPKPLLMLPAPQPLKMLPAVASRKVRVFSFGGGVQSHAVLVLQAQGKLSQPYDYFVFANVGADSENPDTLAYIEKYTKPFCEKHGIRFVEVQKQRGRGKNKTPDTLVELIYRTQKSVPIPARMGGNGAPGRRSCTVDFKIVVVDGWIKKDKYTHAVVGLGISIDEFDRARDTQWFDKVRDKPFGFMKRREYPLIDMRINRDGCRKLIAEAGLPEPPKSSCYFCPFKKRSEWIDLKQSDPGLFQKAVDIETELNRKRKALGKDNVYMHRDMVLLDQAVGNQPRLFLDDSMDACESGYCMT
jgi:hypothetical protein